MVKLKPVPGKTDWFELASRPYRPDYLEVYEFAEDYREELVRGAKIVGWHDDEPLLTDDPRFNRAERAAWQRFYDEDDIAEPSLAVARTPDGYVMMFMCNRPEGMLFEYMLDEDASPLNPDEHFPSYRADSAEREEEYIQKQRAALEATIKANSAKASKPRKPAAKKSAPKK